MDELVEESLGNQDTQIPDLLRNVGLGLVEVTRFVQISRGQVEVESEKGKGTTVSLQLPLLETSLGSCTKLFPSIIPIGADAPSTEFTSHTTPTRATERVTPTGVSLYEHWHNTL